MLYVVNALLPKSLVVLSIPAIHQLEIYHHRRERGFKLVRHIFHKHLNILLPVRIVLFLCTGILGESVYRMLIFRIGQFLTFSPNHHKTHNTAYDNQRQAHKSRNRPIYIQSVPQTEGFSCVAKTFCSLHARCLLITSREHTSKQLICRIFVVLIHNSDHVLHLSHVKLQHKKHAAKSQCSNAACKSYYRNIKMPVSSAHHPFSRSFHLYPIPLTVSIYSLSLHLPSFFLRRLISTDNVLSSTNSPSISHISSRSL